MTYYSMIKIKTPQHKPARYPGIFPSDEEIEYLAADIYGELSCKDPEYLKELQELQKEDERASKQK